jgi:hypothetical protein
VAELHHNTISSSKNSIAAEVWRMTLATIELADAANAIAEALSMSREEAVGVLCQSTLPDGRSHSSPKTRAVVKVASTSHEVFASTIPQKRSHQSRKAICKRSKDTTKKNVWKSSLSLANEFESFD